MGSTWTFGQKVAVGFALVVGLAVLTAAVAVYALRTVVESKDEVINRDARLLIDAAKLNAAMEFRVASSRGYLLTRDDSHLERFEAANSELATALRRLQEGVRSAEGRSLLVELQQASETHRQAVDRLIALRKGGGDLAVIARQFDDDIVPKRRAADRLVEAFVAREEAQLEQGRDTATATAVSATNLLIGLAAGSMFLALLVALILVRTLSRQIGSAVQHVQSSSTELQSAANQQATGAKETATAMNEITTTISELLATSRQIADSAQRVAHMAQEGAAAARGGDDRVQLAQESMGAIRRQVDAVVNHMLELGKKSQQIGGILEIINELAEQTNILAINATIEAAGAGEAGRRFAVVGEEIRKLADRVGGSTREIRTLIDEIRAAVNTTVMATEGGSKAVDQGMRQFGEVAAGFKQIAALVGTTTEAAREIELSTKQQSTAVEQVNVAITGAAQATRETEASSGQTLVTATELSTLSRDLARLIQPQAA